MTAAYQPRICDSCKENQARYGSDLCVVCEARALDAAERREETGRWMETQAGIERWGIRGTA